MKQLLVANWQPTGKVLLANLQRLLDAQIENSLALGWQPAQIILVTNFEYRQHGVVAQTFEGLNEHCLRGSKMFALHRLFETGQVAQDDIVWAHDLDAWQNHPFQPPAFQDIGLAEYSRPKFNGGSVFVRATARDLVARIVAEILANHADREEPTINRVLREASNLGRVTVLNSTYNLGCSGFPSRWSRSEKPILVSHFHPTNRLAWDTHVNDRNGLGDSASPRLKELLIRHFHNNHAPEKLARTVGKPPNGQKAERTVFSYSSYREYVSLQRLRSQRSLNVTNRYGWYRRRLVEQLHRLSPASSTMLCLGARSDVEVQDFQSLGFLAEGIDLFSSERITKCDMARIDRHRAFASRTFDVFVAVHALEHCLDFPGFLRGLAKCNHALACVTPQLVTPNAWDCSAFRFALPTADPAEIELAFPGFRLAWSEVVRKTLLFVLLRDLPTNR